MIFNENNLLHYLFEKGLVNRETAVNGPLLIVDASSRNRNFKVLPPGGGGLFVKQVKESDPTSQTFLKREAAIYQAATSGGPFKLLAEALPLFHLYDQTHHALIVDLLDEGEDMSSFHRRLGRFPVNVAARLGQTMAAYHQLPFNEEQAHFPKAMPWILRADQLQNGQMAQTGLAKEQVLQIISQYPAFNSYLAAIREQWQRDRFIHGDMKWENCLLRQENGRLDFQIVDWETADIGDAAWDTGAIFQSYLTFWIMSIPVNGQGMLGQLLDQAHYPIEAMQPAIQAFWERYADGLPAAERQNHLLRATNYAAVRMCQTAYEYMAYSPHMTLNGLGLLQVSMNILDDPLGAAAELLGLKPNGG